MSVLAPNENGLVVVAAVVAGVPNEMALLTAVGSLALPGFSAVTAPKLSDSCDLSALPKIGFTANEFNNDGGVVVETDFIVVIVACFSVLSFGLMNDGADVVILVTCCVRFDNCAGSAAAAAAANLDCVCCGCACEACNCGWAVDISDFVDLANSFCFANSSCLILSCLARSRSSSAFFKFSLSFRALAAKIVYRSQMLCFPINKKYK